MRPFGFDTVASTHRQNILELTWAVQAAVAEYGTEPYLRQVDGGHSTAGAQHSTARRDAPRKMAPVLVKGLESPRLCFLQSSPQHC